MKNAQILMEYLAPQQAQIISEQVNGGRDWYLNGIMMQAEVVNGNGRKYLREEIERAVEYANKKIAEGNPVMGELNHPDHLQIDLKNVSHIITEVRMDGNNAIGKMKLLNTPNGQIARALIEGGARLGVSSRGSGNVNEGVVSDFSFVTVDIVAQPSAPDAYPSAIRESIDRATNGGKILSLAEAVCHDGDAQKYFKREIDKFLDVLLNG
jgi:hypothetical protein